MTEGLLLIGTWSSSCGGCGKHCDPYEKSHETILPGYSKDGPKEGCHMVYTHVVSTYGPYLEDRVKEMRPDLEYYTGEDLNG